jgi:hypothetical protein
MDNHDVLRERRHRYHTFSRAYDSAASRVSDRARWLAVATASLSALVSSAIFTSLATTQVATPWKLVTGAVSLLATVLGAGAAALGYRDAAASYRSAALTCVALKHQAEELIVRSQITDQEVIEYDKRAIEAEGGLPVVTDRDFRKAEAYCDGHRGEDPFESSVKATA